MGQALRHRSLTSALDDAGSAPRKHVDALLANAAGVRTVQARFAEAVGPLVIGSLGANAGTIGTAFDIAIRFLIDPAPDMSLAEAAARSMGPLAHEALGGLLSQVGARSSPRPTHRTEFVATPLDVPPRNREETVRAAWALALFVEAFRTGGLMAQSPLALVLADASKLEPQDLLAMAPSVAVEELSVLIAVAQDALLSPLESREGPWYLGPVFSLSGVLPADGDLIAAGMLVEVKSNLGGKRVDGRRYATVDRATLRQIVGYVLHDADDAYRLTQAALYSARYGHLETWNILDLLEQTAGRPVDLEEERRIWAEAVSSVS